MRARAILASACLLTLLVAQPATADPMAGTSSIGNVDTWNLPRVPCEVKFLRECLEQPCMPYFGDRLARLHLVDAGPLDQVALTVLRADAYYGAPVAVASAGNDAVVEYRVNGCGVPLTTFVVTGLLVDGEVGYELTIGGSDGLEGLLESICDRC